MISEYAWMYAACVSVFHAMTKLHFADWGVQKCLRLVFIIATWNDHT